MLQKVMVVGAGQMGNGIAQVAATAGLQVILNDLNEELAQRGYGNIERILTKDVQKNKIDEAKKRKF